MRVCAAGDWLGSLVGRGTQRKLWDIQTEDSKALLVLPYVAFVQEKVRWLRNVVQGIPRAGASEGPDNHEPHPGRISTSPT